MNLDDLAREINTLADEDYELEIVVSYINDAIAAINIECDTIFPNFDLNDPSKEYTAFPEKWQRTLLIPFAVGRLKQLDSSQFEYTDAYNEFLTNLAKFRRRFSVPEAYKDKTAKPNFVQEDLYNNPFAWNKKPKNYNPLG